MSKVSKLKKLGIMLIVSGMLMSMLTACGGGSSSGGFSSAAFTKKVNDKLAAAARPQLRMTRRTITPLHRLMRRIRPIRTKTMKRVTLPWTIR